jgi:hypothetical protein
MTQYHHFLYAMDAIAINTEDLTAAPILTAEQLAELRAWVSSIFTENPTAPAVWLDTLRLMDHALAAPTGTEGDAVRTAAREVWTALSDKYNLWSDDAEARLIALADAETDDATAFAVAAAVAELPRISADDLDDDFSF